MKNEKLTKNDIKEKMMKKFDKGMVIAWAIRNLFIIMAAFCLLMLIVAVIIALVQSGGSNVIQTLREVVNEWVTALNLSGESNVVFAISSSFKYIIITIICDRIGKVFKDSKEAETPFCDANVRNIAIISELAWLYALYTMLCVEGFAAYELVTATLISVIYYIFKYGCELQEQSDETL